MKLRKTEVITCPHCGREYLPAEIYMPKDFFGKPSEIERDYQGKIMDFMGKSIDYTESFICDACDKKFFVSAQIRFTSSQDPINRFQEESKIMLKKPSLFNE